MDRRQQLPQSGFELDDVDLGLGRQLVGLELAGLGAAQLGDLDLRPPAIAHFEDAGDVDRAAAAAERVELLGPLPADRLGGPGRVADREPQPGVAVALAPQLAGADRVDAAHPLAVLELAQRDPLQHHLGLGLRGGLRQEIGLGDQVAGGAPRSPGSVDQRRPFRLWLGRWRRAERLPRSPSAAPRSAFAHPSRSKVETAPDELPNRRRDRKTPN